MGAVSPAWADGLLAAGARCVFGVAGSSNFALLARYREQGGQYVPAQHEAGATAMATGWAAAGHGVGIASVHQGPGLTNAVTALVDADRSGYPVVLIAGQADDAGHHQWLDARSLAASLQVAAWAPDGDAHGIEEAIDWAVASRRALLVLPDGYGEAPPVRPEAPTIAVVPSEVFASLGPAQRIAIVAGRGALHAGAVPLLCDLADHLDALLVTTAPAAGAFADHPRSAGIIGGFATPGTTRAMQECDVVLVFGASLDGWSTAGGRMFAEGATIAVFDPRRAANGDPGTFAMDAQDAASALLRSCDAREATGWATAAAANGRAGRSFMPADELDPRVLLDELDRRLPSRRRMSFDSGHFLAIAGMMMTRMHGPLLQFGQDFQAVGLGLAHAIGASAGDTEHITVAVIGDGGAGMSMTELATAVDLRLPLLVTIVNDGGYGAEVHDFAPLGLPVSIAQQPQRDWAGVARALGAQGLTVRSLDDLAGLDQWLDDPGAPLVLDCHVDPSVDAISIMTVEGRAEWSHIDT
jgi:thiamine pyrophosphate-dependent acetolactate synthase large subunit-like protein